MYKLENGTYLGTDEKTPIHYYIYHPLTKPRAVLQLSHGMCEYIERYNEFADFLTSKGFVVCGNDHLGHGKTARDGEELGYFAKQDGWQLLPEDLHLMTLIAKKAFPDLPFFMLGHSMGSFVSRIYVTKYGSELDGLILSGTGQGGKSIDLAVLAAKTVAEVKGNKYRSELLNKGSFGLYNSHIRNPKTNYDWTTRDEKIVEKYVADARCNYTFTASGFADLAKMLSVVSEKEWTDKVPQSLPILLISGDCDPVGDYAKGVRQIYANLKKTGHNVKIKIYHGARHEVINEINRAEVYANILKWLDYTISYIKT